MEAQAAEVAVPAGSTLAVLGARAVVLAATVDEPQVLLAVLRDRAPDSQRATRAEVLQGFVAHAALVTTNALLFEQAQEALAHQVDLNREKDEFLAAVSHELRTPLASMLGSVDTLRRLDERLDPDARARLLAIASRQGRRLHRLIEELLLTAALEHGREAILIEPADLGAVAREAVGDIELDAPGRVRLRIDGDGVTATDPAKVRQVLTNLIENALKYAGPGPIEVEVSTRRRGAVLTVIDHGPGVAPEDEERVFERFVQLDGSSTRSQGGTGLGLYLCRRVADLLGAELTLSETPGGGATFRLVVPSRPAFRPLVSRTGATR
jgi:two-component system OmpR family sensor kinase